MIAFVDQALAEIAELPETKEREELRAVFLSTRAINLLFASDLRAQMPVEKADPELLKLIDKLGDEEPDVRDQATAKLKAAGFKALPALRQSQ